MKVKYGDTIVPLLRYRHEATVSHLFDFCEEKTLPPAGCVSRAPPARARSRDSPQIKKSIPEKRLAEDVHPNKVPVYPISTYKISQVTVSLQSAMRHTMFRTDLALYRVNVWFY